jgi:hypothetical protein
LNINHLRFQANFFARPGISHRENHASVYFALPRFLNFLKKRQKPRSARTMKNYWIAVLTVGLAFGVNAQTGAGAGASASGSASASAGKNGASANTGANADVSARGSASGKSGDNRGGGSGNGKGSSSTSASGNAAAGLSSGTQVQAELTKPLDVKKARPGDEVTAKVTQDVKADGHVVVHKGSKLVGHVTEAKTRTKEDSESRLGIAFDRAILKDGQEVSLGAMVQALAPPANLAASAVNDDSASVGGTGGGGRGGSRAGGGGGLGGVAGGVTSNVGATTGAVGGVGNTVGSVAGSTTGAVGGAVNGAGRVALDSTSRGVVGLQGLTLNSAASSTTQASVISSTTQNVKLDSGTQMLLNVR